MFLFCSHEVNGALVPLGRSFDIGRTIRWIYRRSSEERLKSATNKDSSHLTKFDELVPSSAHRLEPEIIEALFEALSARGIHVREA
jgi:hypothetical protein